MTSTGDNRTSKDLLSRLRETAQENQSFRDECNEAADEIEKLRAEVLKAQDGWLRAMDRSDRLFAKLEQRAAVETPVLLVAWQVAMNLLREARLSIDDGNPRNELVQRIEEFLGSVDELRAADKSTAPHPWPCMCEHCKAQRAADGASDALSK